MSFPKVFLSKSRVPGQKLNRRSLRRRSLRAPVSIKQSATRQMTLPPPYTVYVERPVSAVQPVVVHGPQNAPAPALASALVSAPTAVAKQTEGPLVLWVGEDRDDLFAKGSLYGFNCQWFNNLDLSILPHAKCIVVCCAETVDKLFSFINFACEYGVPSIWLNRSLPLDVCFWSFNSRLHVNDSAFFWRDLCHLIE